MAYYRKKNKNMVKTVVVSTVLFGAGVYLANTDFISGVKSWISGFTGKVSGLNANNLGKDSDSNLE